MSKNMSRYTEKELIILLKGNHKTAFEYLYDHYSPSLYGIIFKIVKDEDIACDVMQDTFLKIWRNIQRYDAEKGTLFTWILNIARNTAIDHLRSALKYKNHVSWGTQTAASLDQQLIYNPIVTTIDVRSIVARLLPQKRELIEMVYFKGYTHEEVSEQLGLPLGTVKSRIRRALQQLAQTFSDADAKIQLVGYANL